MLMEGARRRNEQDRVRAAGICARKARGVKFEICEITLKEPQPEERPPILDADCRPVWCASPSCKRATTTPTSSPERLWGGDQMPAVRASSFDCRTLLDMHGLHLTADLFDCAATRELMTDRGVLQEAHSSGAPLGTYRRGR